MRALQLAGMSERTQSRRGGTIPALFECWLIFTTTVDVLEFMRRFLQHVLPTGFMKVRYYGFMNPNASVALDRIKALIELAHGFEVKSPQSDIKPLPPLTCCCCGGNLAYRYSLLPYQFKDAADTG